MSKIMALDIEGFKRIKAAYIKRPDNGQRVFQITGRNGSGKTSCLDAMLVALKGMSAFKGQSEPINIDADRAMIRIDLGDYIVTRVFRRPKPGGKSQEITTEVRVETRDGFRAPEPQRLLESWLGPLTVDPFAFSRMPSLEQRDTMRGFVAGFDFEANAKARQQVFDTRTAVNRQAKDADGIAAMVKLPDDIATDAQPIDEGAIAQQLVDASSTNADIERRKANRSKAEDKIAELNREAVRLKEGLEGRLAQISAQHDQMARDIQQQIAALQARLASVETARDTTLRGARDEVAQEVQEAEAEAQHVRGILEAAEPLLPEPVDVQAVVASLNDARRINASIRVREDHLARLANAKRLHDEAAALTARIDEFDKEKADAIVAAKLPVPGLTIGEDGILLDGLPFSQASDAQRLRTSCAIAMSLPSELRVLRVRDGSLLDPDGLALLEEMANEHDYDIWIERVDVSGAVGIVIENGYVRGQEPAEDERQGALV